ncbi:MAG TPA: carboxylating nicotinate-nucleotide diphosphorylase [Fimbriimonadaceae bacterium]|nr:carboxylating nicotinate-nucleotide diphosphorylase [Fimbriimonadaceae bacterium]
MSTWLEPEPYNWAPIVEAALVEDLGTGDLSAGCVPVDSLANWRIETQADGIICGLGIAEYLLSPTEFDPEGSHLMVHAKDGDRVSPGTTVASGRLQTQRALSSERVTLNFLMHLSGIASLTNRFAQLVEGTGARVIDTRKTLPGMRVLQKYAVRCGGGSNHRMGLYDGVMVKDNHIVACGSIQAAVDAIRRTTSHMYKIEVEATTAELAEQAIQAGAEVVLLDNMTSAEMREIVVAHKGKCLFEASGGINLDTVREVAESGVDFISVGALTHSAPSLSIHMEFE